jgi:hypothetical protein
VLIDRVIGVFKLDINTFEDIEKDQGATSQAAMVVLLVALLSGLGGAIGGRLTDSGFVGGFLSAFISVFLGWVLWSAVTYFVGKTLFGGEADMGEMLRVIGFAFAPQLLGIIPCVGAIVGAIWSLVAGFFAVRQGLDLDNTKAFFTIGVGLVAYVIIRYVLNLLLGPIGL